MYANLTREERDTRAEISSDQCIIDGQWFFIRGCLDVPVNESTEPFVWGLWASVREEVFDEISAAWEEPGRERIRGSFKGRLANSLSTYPTTLNMKTKIVIQPMGTRPLFILEELEHPFAAEQQSGITEQRAQELAALLLHQVKHGWPSEYK